MSRADGRKRAKNRVFTDIRQFSTCFSAMLQPISLKPAQHIATISPNNPLKFQPDRPRWGRAVSQAVRQKSAENGILPDFRQCLARYSAVSQPIGPVSEIWFPKGAQWCHKNFSQAGQAGFFREMARIMNRDRPLGWDTQITKVIRGVGGCASGLKK